MTQEHELIAPADAPRLDLLVAQALDVSRNQAATLIAEGRVQVVADRVEITDTRAPDTTLLNPLDGPDDPLVSIRG